MRRFASFSAGALALCAGALPAFAAEPAELDADGVPPIVSTHRSGFSFGIAGGLVLLGASGYPNDVTKIGDPAAHAELDLAASSGGSLWLGGALTDWLNLGIGTLGANGERGGSTASGGAIQARIEAFPLFYQGGAFRDLGLLFTAGTGGYTIERGSEKVAEGEGTSVVGFGAFYEPWRLWRFAVGPQVEYCHHFSRSLSAHLLVIGVRTAFYGGP